MYCHYERCLLCRDSCLVESSFLMICRHSFSRFYQNGPSPVQYFKWTCLFVHPKSCATRKLLETICKSVELETDVYRLRQNKLRYYLSSPHDDKSGKKLSSSFQGSTIKWPCLFNSTNVQVVKSDTL